MDTAVFIEIETSSYGWITHIDRFCILNRGEVVSDTVRIPRKTGKTSYYG